MTYEQFEALESWIEAKIETMLDNNRGTDGGLITSIRERELRRDVLETFGYV